MSKLQEILSKTPSWLRLYNRKYQLTAVERMNEVLRSSGMSQKELAERAGWSEGYVSRLLSGRQNLTLKTLARFEDAVGSEVLQVTVDRTAAVREVLRAMESWRNYQGVKVELLHVPMGQRDRATHPRRPDTLWVKTFQVGGSETHPGASWGSPNIRHGFVRRLDLSSFTQIPVEETE